MKAFSLQTDQPATQDALADLDRQLAHVSEQPELILAFYGCEHGALELNTWLATRFPDAPVLGGSSSGGTMGTTGMGTVTSIGLMLFFDPDGDYGSGAAPKGNDPAAAALAALEDALEAADCSGLMPDLVWVYQSPGAEEAVLEALSARVGADCPIFGGSAADNDVSGSWSQIGGGQTLTDGVVIGVFFPSGEIGFSFQGGYEPSGDKGVISDDRAGADTARVVSKIDDQPAAQVYNAWTDGAIAAPLENGGSVLAETTMFPLGVEMGLVNGVQQYRLVHPEAVTDGGGLTTFANLTPGTEVFCMTGEKDKLTTRAGQVVAQAAETLTCDSPAAALIVYCGGCRLAVGDRVGAVHSAVAAALPAETPFIGTFTFGEQGMLVNRNLHANLMISAVVFGG